MTRTKFFRHFNFLVHIQQIRPTSVEHISNFIQVFKIFAMNRLVSHLKGVLWNLTHLILIQEILHVSAGLYGVIKAPGGVPVCSVNDPDTTIHQIRSTLVCAGYCSMDFRCKDFEFSKNAQLCNLFHNPEKMLFIQSPGCLHYKVKHRFSMG